MADHSRPGARNTPAAAKQPQPLLPPPPQQDPAMEKEEEEEDVAEEEIVDMAIHLGQNVRASSQLSEAQLWIIDRALEAPLPDGWQEHCDPEGRSYYYNTASQQSTWDHPMDDHFREMMKSASAQRKSGGRANRQKLQDELDSALGTPKKKQDSATAAAGKGHSTSGNAGRQSGSRSQQQVQEQKQDLPHQNVMEPLLSRKAQRKVATILGLDAAGAAEVGRVAELLGIDPLQEPGLLWIAEQGVDAPLPEGWRKISNGGARVAYVNNSSGTVVTEHPLHPQLRKLVHKMRREQPQAGGASSKYKSSSRWRHRRFSDSDGLDDSHGKSVDDCSFGDTLDGSDSWSEGDEGEGGIIAKYRGRWGSGRPSTAEASNGPLGKGAAMLGASFSFKDGLASRLGSAVQEATGAVNTLLVRAHNNSEGQRRPASALPIGVCSLGSLPKSRSAIAAREANMGAAGLGNRLRHSLTLGSSKTFGHSLGKRREDVYRVPEDYHG
mmetsp:Transcript_14063/g.39847  ORF Transcript_14063/g.39847 Transcript_14063/m.39847 type:complete len:495 (+) Transcript_14063:293-1777(+)